MDRTALPRRTSAIIVLVCAAACISCTYTLRFANKPEFHPVSIGGLTFTPSIRPGGDGAVLRLETSRANPVTDAIDTIRLADISVRLDKTAFMAMSADHSLPLTLQQEGNAEVLLESGDAVLTGNLFADLPEGVSPQAYNMVIITYGGESATSYLQPAQ